ncbi:hypothetical protein SLS62_010879 [Diatrype stigma]|uniref:UV-endonuclease UvdE n=1 Tax=Diatrype stigma TaxID=117547 RepID=A0AAN9UA19_9PEZI
MFRFSRHLIRLPNALSGFHRFGVFTPGPYYIPSTSGTPLSSFSTMGSKKRKTTMALLYENDPFEEVKSDSATATVTPRRSLRHQGRDDTEGLRPTGNPQKPSQGLQSNGMPEGLEKLNPPSLSTRIQKDSLQDSGSVKKAMERLRKMEDSLSDSNKRQKRMVDESLVNVPKTEETVFFPVPEEIGPPNIPPEMEQKGLDQMEPVLCEEQEGNPLPAPLAGGDPEDRDLYGVPEETDVNLFKQEGARPPPVNNKEQAADVSRGQKYVENLGLANARDVIKMLHWNEKYGIRFLRLSSEMFPFASHIEHGYKIEPFAAETLAEVGKVAAKYGHRLTTHPGQFTQLGSPRPEVIASAIRDLEYHDEMLSLLRLPEQQNKDAVMIIHMGGVYGDKEATLDRFRSNYKQLSPSIKRRLVLENDDVSWTVHDILPVCEELNIPMVLDFHHHNILFDPDKIREGTKDIVDLYPRIRATWERKGITQKMHYSEPCPEAVTPRQRRKHSPRVMTLPPCAPDMDLMIEAKDKEQAVLNLMRNFRLPGWDRFNDVIPYEREDENRPPPKPPAKKKQPKRASPSKKKKNKDEDGDGEESEELLLGQDLEQKQQPEPEPEQPPKPPPEVAESDIAMGGPQSRVFWPVGMDEWLRPKKREVKKKTPAIATAAAAGLDEGSLEETVEAKTPAKAKSKRKAKAKAKPKANVEEEEEEEGEGEAGNEEEEGAKVLVKLKGEKRKRKTKAAPDGDDGDDN